MDGFQSSCQWGTDRAVLFILFSSSIHDDFSHFLVSTYCKVDVGKDEKHFFKYYKMWLWHLFSTLFCCRAWLLVGQCSFNSNITKNTYDCSPCFPNFLGLCGYFLYNNPAGIKMDLRVRIANLIALYANDWGAILRMSLSAPRTMFRLKFILVSVFSG